MTFCLGGACISSPSCCSSSTARRAHTGATHGDSLFGSVSIMSPGECYPFHAMVRPGIETAHRHWLIRELSRE